MIAGRYAPTGPHRRDQLCVMLSECGTNKAHDRPQTAPQQPRKPPRRSIRRGSRSWRWPMSGASRRRAPSSPPICTASSASGAGTAPRPPEIEPLVERLVRLGYVDDARLRAVQGAVAGGSAAMASGASPGAAPGRDRRGATGRRAPRRWRRRRDGGGDPICPAARGWGRSRPNRPIPSAASARWRR